MNDYTVLTDDDNVAVALVPILKGTRIDHGTGITLGDDIQAGHKFALLDIPEGADIVKYGSPIGHAAKPIAAGEWVHIHNVRTNLNGEVEYSYEPTPILSGPASPDAVFMGYRRPNGRVGIRNELWIIPTVGCVNRLAERLAAAMNRELPDGCGAAAAFPHPHGCSQMSQDHESTRTILANLALHPNAGAVLFVGLGCENNTVDEFRKLVELHPDRNPNIEYLVAQKVEDEYESGLEILRRQAKRIAEEKRVPVPVSELRIGLKCGGSDGLSGITANPLFGMFSDWLVDNGGFTALTEVPEMFGAEKSLLNRAVNKDVFDRGARMINDFKRYFQRYGQTIYENPSPGNKDGGITTLEDKSLGCTQKGGTRPVVDVQPYGGLINKPGLTLVAGPGNDIVAVTLLAAAGAHIVLFSTGRGTPLGSPVPVLKVASNSTLASAKPKWVDFDANPLITGEDRHAVLARFIDLVIEVASGRQTRSEELEARDFAIFKDGVTL